MARRDGLGWHGGPRRQAAEGMVTSVGINDRAMLAIEPDAPSVPRPSGAVAAFDAGLNLEVQRLDQTDRPLTPSGRVRLTRT